MCRQKVLMAEQRFSLEREMELGRLSLVGVHIFVSLYCFINIYYAYNLIQSNKYSPVLATQNTLVTVKDFSHCVLLL